MADRKEQVKMFQQSNKEITEVFETFNDKFDVIDEIAKVLENNNLSKDMTAEIMLNVFNAGVKRGKKQFQQQIASL